MAHHPSAVKRIRQTERRTEVRRARVQRIRTFLRHVERAIASGDRGEAQAAFRAVEPELMRGVNAGVLHRNMAARKLSRLSARIKALSATP
jgi:small subunit ribosomal protein S20